MWKKIRQALCGAYISGELWFTVRCVLAEGHCGECSGVWDDIGRKSKPNRY